MKYQCLIVEDELPAQRVLKKFISDIPSLELEEICNNALDASTILMSQEIDILFLDVHLPKISGVDFLKSLKNPPQVIFTTAYSQYAVDGFALEATDYLLKPFSFDRFLKAVNKAIEQIQLIAKSQNKNNKDNTVKTSYMLENDSIFIKADKKLFRIDLKNILYVESLKDYVKIVSETDSNVVLQTLKHWENILPLNTFKRSHKSYIVNLNKIDAIEGNIIKIKDIEIPIGRSFREALIKEIEKRLL